MPVPPRDHADPTPADHPVLSVVVPMYRESRRIGATLTDVTAALRAGSVPAEVILIDDGSDDGSAAAAGPWLADARAGNLLSVRLLRHDRNRGKGAAIRTGLAAARGEWRLTMDADSACRVTEVSKLLAAAGRTGAALIAGSRRKGGAVVRNRLRRRVLGSVFRACMRLLGLAIIRDTQCGFKLYRADLADLIVATAREQGFAHDLEHLLIARRGGFGIAEVGVVWSHVGGGTVRPLKDGLRMLARAVVIRARYPSRARPVPPARTTPAAPRPLPPPAPEVHVRPHQRGAPARS